MALSRMKRRRLKAKKYLTVREAAEVIGRAYCTVREWVLEGRLPSVKRRKKSRTFYRVKMEDAIKAREKLESGLWL